jgi:trehalose-phosphatase
MHGSLQSALEWAVTEYHHGRPLVLLFEYDGTLAEFTDHPAEARVPEELIRALEAVARLPGVTAGVISGRSLDDLKQMLNVAGLCYAGTSGLEIEYDGATVTHPLVAHSTRLVNEVAGGLEAALREFPGAWVERKPFGMTVHYREVDGKLISSLHAELDQILSRWPDRLHIVTGAKAIEITPNLGWTKGTAVQLLLERVGERDCIVLYAGDEASDVEALWNVGIHHGIAIGVGPAPCTTAEFNLPNTHAVQNLLVELGAALGCPGEHVHG